MRQSSLLLIFLLILSACTENKSPSPEDLSVQIRSILELPTFEHIYRDIVYIDKERMFLIFKTSQTEVLFAVDVRIQAGLDLREGFLITREDDTLTVYLPRAKILLADADEETIEQYFLKEIRSSISRLDYYDEINRKKLELIDDAVERGILEKAYENAKLLVSNFLKMAGYEEVIFADAEDIPS
ncbi:MAG: DUF4230 domain-containing protein [Spirochaetales bacterium]|nr:DUF4230 domain-containing protein [Spirochaetales bacterium]